MLPSLDQWGHVTKEDPRVQLHVLGMYTTFPLETLDKFETLNVYTDKLVVGSPLTTKCHTGPTQTILLTGNSATFLAFRLQSPNGHFFIRQC